MRIEGAIRFYAILFSILAIGCVASYFVRNRETERAAFLFLSFSILALPAVAGLFGSAFGSRHETALYQALTSRAHSIVASACAAVSYALCVAVLARALEIPWRHIKFGTASLTLGRTSALTFALLSLLIAGLLIPIARNPTASGSAAKTAMAGLTMQSLAVTIYAVIGLSPFAIWHP